MRYFYILISFTLLTSCFKTAKEIKREKTIDNQLVQSSKIVADLTTQVNGLKSRLAETSGQLEEFDHKSSQDTQNQESSFKEAIAHLTQQVSSLKEENKEIQEKVSALSRKVNAQKKFIKKVNTSLSKLDNPKPSSSKSLLKQAHQAFEKNKQKKARALYAEVLQLNKVSNAKKNHIFFNLGLMSFWNKQFNQALVYFSKIYTKFPKSSYAAKSLLYIARSFKKINKLLEAKASYQELIDNYPKSKQATTAKKEIL